MNREILQQVAGAGEDQERIPIKDLTQELKISSKPQNVKVAQLIRYVVLRKFSTRFFLNNSNKFNRKAVS